MLVSKQKLAIGIGALAGGTISDDEGFGTVMGIAVGAGVGYKWEFVEPREISTYKAYNKEADISQVAIPDREQEIVDKYFKQLMSGKYNKLLDSIPKEIGKGIYPVIDFDDLPRTLTSTRLIKDWTTFTNEQKIKLMRHLRNHEGFVNADNLPGVILDVESNNGFVIKGDTRSHKELEALSRRKTELLKYFQGQGYSQQQAEDLSDLLFAGKSHAEDIHIDTTKNTIRSSTGSTFKVPTVVGDGLSVYSDSKNLYAAKKVNLFGSYIAGRTQDEIKMLRNKIDPKDPNSLTFLEADIERMLESLEIKDDKIKDVFRRNFDRWASEGMSGLELKALVQHSPVLSKQQDYVNNIVDASFEYLREESGKNQRGMTLTDQIAQGFRQFVYDTGWLTDNEKVINFNKNGLIADSNKDNPFRTLSNHKKDGVSELGRFIENVEEFSGIKNVKLGVSINNPTATIVRPDKKYTGLSFMSPAERQDKERPAEMHINKNVKGLRQDDLYILQAHEELKARGLLDSQLQSNMFFRTLSVDQDDFNNQMLLNNTYDVEVYNKQKKQKEIIQESYDISSGDGFSIARQPTLNAYQHKQMTTVEFNGPAGSVQLSKEVHDILAYRAKYGVNINSELIKGPSSGDLYAKPKIKNVLKAAGLHKGMFDPKVFDNLERDLLDITSGQKALTSSNVEDVLDKYIEENVKINRDLHTKGIKLPHHRYQSKRLWGKPGSDKRTKIVEAIVGELNPIAERRLAALEYGKKVLTEAAEVNLPAYQNMLKEIEDSLVNKTHLDATARRLDDFIHQRNQAIKGKLHNNTVGIQNLHVGVGDEGHISRVITQGTARLHDVQQISRSDGTIQTRILIDGASVAKEEDTYKIYGTGIKVNAKAKSGNVFDRLIRTIHDLQLSPEGADLQSVAKASVIAESGSTGQKQALKLYNALAKGIVDSDDYREALDYVLEFNEQGGDDFDKFLADHSRKPSNLRVEYATKKLQELKFSPKLQEYFAPVFEEALRFKDPDLRNQRLWAGVQMMTAHSEGKGTNNAVRGLKIGGATFIQEAFAKLKEGDAHNLAMLHHKTGVGDTSFINYLQNLSQNDPDELLNLTDEIENLKSAFYADLEDVYSAHSHDRYVSTYFSGDDSNFRSDRMKGWYQIAYNDVGLIWSGGYKSEDADAWTGAGGEDKKLSHFAVQGLMDKGYDQQLLDIFSRANPMSQYDSTAFLLLEKAQDKIPTLDQLIDIMAEEGGTAKARQVISDIMSKETRPEHMLDKLKMHASNIKDPNKRKQALEMIQGMDVDKDGKKIPYLFFNLPIDDDGSGIKSLALYRQSTNHGGLTKTSNGVPINTTLRNNHASIMLRSIDYRDSTLRQMEGNVAPEKSPLRLNLSTELSRLATYYRERFISENNPWVKDIFSRDADNSAFLKVVDTGNTEFTLRAEEALKEGKSIIGLSKKRALDMLRNQGLRIDKDEDIMKYIQDGMLFFDEGKTQPAIFLNHREPAISHMSLRHVNVMILDKGLTDSEIAISSKDRIYTKMLFGDMDNDNVYLMAPNKKITDEDYAKLSEMQEFEAKFIKKALPILEHLGVKGTGAGYDYDIQEAWDYIKSNYDEFGLTQAEAEDSSNVKVQELIQNRHENRLGQAIAKAGERKVTTPIVTKMVMNLVHNSAFDIAASDFDKEAVLMAHGLGHYVIENLIKSSHTKTGVKSPLDELLEANQAFKKGGGPELREVWVEKMSAFMDDLFNDEDLLEKLRQDPEYKGSVELFEQGKEVIKKTLLNQDPNQIANTLDLSSYIRKIDTSKGINVVPMMLELINMSNKAGMGKATVGVPVKDTTLNKKATASKVIDGFKTIIMDNIKANSFPLAVGAGVLGLGALLFQKNPDFDSSSHLPSRGEVSAMTLAPNVMEDDSNLVQRLGRETSAYITPAMDTARMKAKTLEAYGGYEDYSQRSEDAINQAVFGDSISSVRVDHSYGY